jgi:AcrR family transcriptional regulator
VDGYAGHVTESSTAARREAAADGDDAADRRRSRRAPTGPASDPARSTDSADPRPAPPTDPRSTLPTDPRSTLPTDPRSTLPTDPPAAPVADVEAPTTGARARTRRAILDAAVAVFSANPAASLGEVAQAAQVGRSTLHRYFPERADLIRAVGAEALDRTRAAIVAARIDEGDPAAALRRLVIEYFGLGPWYMLLFAEPLLADDEAFWQESDVAEAPVRDLFERGQQAGVFDPTLTVSWNQRTVWWTLFNAWSVMSEECASRSDALRMAVRSIEGVVLAPPTGHAAATPAATAATAATPATTDPAASTDRPSHPETT